MAIILNATPSNGLNVNSDNSGGIQFQSNTLNTLSISTSGLMTAAYNGANPGLVPGQQMFVLNTPYTGQNATGNQSIFGLTNGVTLNSNTIYAFEAVVNLIKTTGTTSHTFSTLFGGTATINNVAYNVSENDGNGGMNSLGTVTRVVAINQATATGVATGLTASTQWMFLILKGIVSINAGGTFLPQYSLSSAPGGAYTTQVGSYFSIYPVSTGTANVAIGSWS